MGLKESGLRGSIRNVSTDIGAAISIDTLEAENVGADSATIRGEITELTNFGEDAEVFFEWVESTGDEPNTTDIQLQDTVGVFTEDLTNLSEDSVHQFRAFGSVRDVSDEGGVLTFETDSAAIPDSVNLEAHYDFSEEDGSMPVSDRSGNELDLDEGSYSGVDVNINGVQAGYFDGVDDGVFRDSFGVTINQPYMVYSVFQLGATNQHGGDGTAWVTPENGGQSRIRTRNGNWNQYAGNNLESGSEDTDPHYRSDRISDNGVLRLDGSEIASGDSGSRFQDSDEAFNLGFRPDDHHSEVRLGEVLVYDTGHDTGTMEEVENYLSDKWSF